ncbi:hypothetical protein [Phenylobacterium immobile]|uniref:hypothetical protein n=1 Tax=Phenylobacterium immobile TaxID=21 RepID=UPI000B340676|nr:hypothetical protein [Phenylobacterium immobile]
MVAIADRFPQPAGRDDGFFLGGALAMTAVTIAGFSLQLGMGRSSFGAPPLVHAHAVVFMGWVAIYLLQTTLAATGRIDLHRKLGWLAAAWIVPMIVLGVAITVMSVRVGRAPFFFRPAQFLIFNPLSLFTFAGLTAAAIVMRRRTDWHRRLHFSGMALLLGPGFGRLLPMPLLIPWAWEATAAVCLLFPIAGMAADLRRTGRVHPAWTVGVGVTLALIAAIEALTFSPLGPALYQAVTRDTPGAAIAPLAFAHPPGPPP